MSATLGLVAAAVALAGLARAAEAAEIKMLASNAVKEAYLHLVPQFETATGHTVKIDWLGTNDIIRRIGAGEVTDIAIAPSYVVDDLIKAGEARGREPGRRGAVDHRGCDPPRRAEAGSHVRRDSEAIAARVEIHRHLQRAERRLSHAEVPGDGHRGSDQGQTETTPAGRIVGRRRWRAAKAISASRR